jgi:hypothetical protein
LLLKLILFLAPELEMVWRFSETLVQASSVAFAHLRQILEELAQASSCMLLTSGGSFWKDWLHKLQTYILWSSFIVSTWLHSVNPSSFSISAFLWNLSVLRILLMLCFHQDSILWNSRENVKKSYVHAVLTERKQQPLLLSCTFGL